MRKKEKEGKKSSGSSLKLVLKTLLILFIINVFCFEGFVIPSSSMEDTLKSGDFIVVNKLAYGGRMPITLSAIPFTQYFTSKIQLPYLRFCGYDTIGINDVVVFNLPKDTLPIDKKTLYIKRIVGLPGAEITIKNKNIYLSNTLYQNPITVQQNYFVRSKSYIDPSFLEKHQIHEGGRYYTGDYDYTFHMSKNDIDILKSRYTLETITPLIDSSSWKSAIYPNNDTRNQSRDNFQSFLIPKKELSINLNSENWDYYAPIIQQFEKHSVTFKDRTIFIDDKAVTSYKFSQNYYFVLGDNRDMSEDSRFWGLVPESHIIGKASFILFSNINKDRFLKKIN